MTHLPYHGDANAAAQDLLAEYGPQGAKLVANNVATHGPGRGFWRDVATLLRLESQDDERSAT